VRNTKDKRKAQLDDATRKIAAGKFSEAEAILSGLLSTYPGDPEVCRRLATLHLKRGQLQVALSEIKFLATAAMRAQDYALAEAMIREYLQVDAKAVQLLELLGQVYEEKGDRSAASEQYTHAIDLLLAHPDPDLADLPAELFQRIKTLSPSSPIVARLTDTFPSSNAPEVQYAASHADEISRAPKPAAQPNNGVDNVPAPVVSLESDADFRKLVSPAPQTEDVSSSADIVVPTSEPVEEAAPPTPASVDFAAETPATHDAVEMSPSATTFDVEPPANLNQPEEAPPVAVAPALRLSDPIPSVVPLADAFASEPSVEEAPMELSAAPEPSTVSPAGERQWTPYTEEPAVESETQSGALSQEPEPDIAVVGGVSGEEVEQAEQLKRPRRSAKRKRKRRPAVDYKAIYMRSRLSRWVKHSVAAVKFTGRLIVSLAVLSVVLPVVTVAVVALAWLALEQKPTEIFQSLATIPGQSMPDPKRNGYFLLLGLTEPAGFDPMKAGYDRWQRVETQRPRCVDASESLDQLSVSADSQPLSRWFRQLFPTSRFVERRAAISNWHRSNQLVLNRYEQWLTMPFDDAGYGTFNAPDCAQVLTIHRLYLAFGFSEGINEGIPRLELDFAAWRNVLAHARTLTMKLLALRALDEDVELLSDLLARPDLDAKVLPRLTRLARPLEPAERSLRYPMHNEFLAEVKLRERGLQGDTDVERPWAILAVSRMPLPKQKALNAHAAYYDAAMKASDVNLNALPSLYEFARTPPDRLMDYVTNPVDNILKLESVPTWTEYAAEIMQADARLRLAGLQARLRVPARDGALNLLGRIAEAGPAFFDPFTGLPMLTNGTKTVLYSIGKDRIDNNADPQHDLTVPIFSAAPAL
jgi:hypothetical protein